jgi:hypothetical protein
MQKNAKSKTKARNIARNINEIVISRKAKKSKSVEIDFSIIQCISYLDRCTAHCHAKIVDFYAVCTCTTE